MSLYQTVILAGGLATRMRPLTERLPKALLPIHDKPFIAYQLEKLKKEGIDRVALCVGFLGEQIEAYVGDGSRFGLEVDYFYDGESLQGTAGAIRNRLDALDDVFFVMYGDSYLPCTFRKVQEAYEKSGKLALMTVFHNQGKWDQSNVEFFEGNILNYSKRDKTEAMDYIDYGLGILSRKALESIEGQDLATVYETLLKRKELVGYEVKERFYEVGSFEGLQEFKDTQWDLQSSI